MLVYGIFPLLFFLEKIGLAAFPYIMSFGFVAVFVFGFLKIYRSKVSGKRNKNIGILIVSINFLLATFLYGWWYGPKIGAATLQPFFKDQELASKLPRTWVFPYGAAFAAIEILPKNYADRVLNDHVAIRELLAAIPNGQSDLFMEEVQLVDTPSCHEALASGERTLDRALKCTKSVLVNRNSVGAYLISRRETSDEVQTLTFSLVANGEITPIARCFIEVRKDALLAAVRRDWERDVTASLLACQKRAISGELSKVIKTGEAG